MKASSKIKINVQVVIVVYFTPQISKVGIESVSPVSVRNHVCFEAEDDNKLAASLRGYCNLLIFICNFNLLTIAHWISALPSPCILTHLFRTKLGLPF